MNRTALELPFTELVHHRREGCREIAQPVSRHELQVRDGSGQGCRIFAVTDRSAGPGPPQDQVFGTSVRGAVASYVERWGPTDRTHVSFTLLKAGFHLLLRSGPYARPVEVVALHCEPTLDGDDWPSVYRRIPHIHVSIAKYPVSRAHFAVELSRHNEVLDSIESMQCTMTAYVQLISAEILEHGDSGSLFCS